MKGYQLFVQFKGDAEVTTGDGWAFRHKANAEGYESEHTGFGRVPNPHDRGAGSDDRR